MNRRLFALLSFFYSVTLFGQSISTTVGTGFTVNGTSNMYKFSSGDTVTIHGYKKKSDKYYFVVETKDYADIISIGHIPFNADEKQLKKLPNALVLSKTDFVKSRKQEVENRKRQRAKKMALDGNVRAVIGKDYVFSPETGTTWKLKDGDTIVIIGYNPPKSAYSSYRYFAIYNDDVSGVFKAYGSEWLFKNNVNLDYLPAIDDPDVKDMLARKKAEIKQRAEDKRRQYQEDALKGNVKVRYSMGSMADENDKYVSFSSGSTLTLVGYSKIDYKHYYALYSPEKAGVFHSASSPDYMFSNGKSIAWTDMPSAFDQRVKAVLKDRQQAADSLKAVKDSMELEDLQNKMANIIKLYREADPVIVTLESWSTNSVGGVEMEISVTNCSTQPIKYITFQGYFKNAVGDKCRNEIGGGTVWKAKGIGPIGPRPTTVDNFLERFDDCRGKYDFDNPTFYSMVADTFSFSAVTIQYMNGKTRTLTGKELEKHVIYK